MQIHNVQQGTNEWLLLRRGKFTASSAQAIGTKGKGLETLVLDKVAEILTNKLSETYTNDDIERGKELEKMARTAYEMNTGNEVKEVGFCELDEYVGCSPDGFVGDNGLVEIKCPKPRVFVEYLYTKKIDKKYFWQMQFQMFVTGREWCDYVVYNQDFDTSCIIARVTKDEESQKAIVEGIELGKSYLLEILKKIKK